MAIVTLSYRHFALHLATHPALPQIGYISALSSAFYWILTKLGWPNLIFGDFYSKHLFGGELEKVWGITPITQYFARWVGGGNLFALSNPTQVWGRKHHCTLLVSTSSSFFHTASRAHETLSRFCIATHAHIQQPFGILHAYSETKFEEAMLCACQACGGSVIPVNDCAGRR